MSSARGSAGLVALLAVLLIGSFVATSLASADWDPSLFTAFGEDETKSRRYAEEKLGDVLLRPYMGHDGKFFFIQANDPLLLHPEENAAYLDRPSYRSQRMLYPLLAGGLGLLEPEAILWAMIGINVAAIAAGTWVTARIAEHLGASPLWGLAFALNLGLISEITIDGGGVVAAVFVFGGVLAVLRRRLGMAVLLLSLGVLAREAMLLAAGGVAAWMWLQRDRRRALITAVVPTAVAGAWAAYVRVRVTAFLDGPQIREIGLPFQGFVEAFRAWTADPSKLTSLITGCAVMAVLVAFAIRALRTRDLLSVGFVGFSALAAVFTEQVWFSWLDITRAVAPVLTAFVVSAFVGAKSHIRSASVDGALGGMER